MNARKPAPLFVMLAAALGMMLVIVQCGGNNNTPAPTPTPPAALSVASVSLNPASVAAGGSAQGTVTLSATTGGSVALSSSNTGVATVPASANVAAGAASATFTVTAVAAGSATITASLGGTQSTATITVTAPQATALVMSLSATSVVGGNPVTGTVILGSPAPAGGAVVTLSGADPVTVPPNVTVPAGQTSATFTVNTRATGGTIPATITATFGGATASAVLNVTAVQVVPAVARFTVSGPSGTDVCKLTNNGNTFDCRFDGSASTAPGAITSFAWTYAVKTTKQESSTTPIFNPNPSCDLILPLPTTKPPSLQMTVTLKVTDSQGNTSAIATNNNVSILPTNQACGF
jgi:hypothetical protein